MKPLSTLLCGLLLLSTVTVVSAAAPAPAPATKPQDKGQEKTPPPPPTPAPPSNLMDAYVVELVEKVQLTDAEKKQVHDIYADNGVALQKILNDDSLSPLQKSQQVSDLRDVRNDKINQLLHNLDRQKAFYEVEADYRVALTQFAADGGLVPPGAPATPAPAAPAPTANTEAPPKKDAGSGPTSTSASPSKPAETTPPPATNAPVAPPM